MTVTDPTTDDVMDQREALRATTPALTVWLTLVPEHIDAAQPSATILPSYKRHPTARWEIGGLACNTHACDPHDVAAALRRLADRIDTATDEATV